MADILDTIDNALADNSVSEDAMRWAPEIPEQVTARIASIYGIPPEMIGGDAGGPLTYSSPEQNAPTVEELLQLYHQVPSYSEAQAEWRMSEAAYRALARAYGPPREDGDEAPLPGPDLPASLIGLRIVIDEEYPSPTVSYPLDERLRWP